MTREVPTKEQALTDISSVAFALARAEDHFRWANEELAKNPDRDTTLAFSIEPWANAAREYRDGIRKNLTNRMTIAMELGASPLDVAEAITDGSNAQV